MTAASSGLKGAAREPSGSAEGGLNGLCLEQLSIGQSAERRHVVAEADITGFAAATGDFNPMHMDEAFAAGTPFRGRIAHGMLSAAYISAVLGNDLPGRGTIYVSQTLRFLRPVRIGDEVIARVVVTAIDSNTGQVSLNTACTVGGKRVVDGEAVVRPPKRDGACA
jgi:3-hydroxybutyryl-CoA dehydratase